MRLRITEGRGWTYLVLREEQREGQDAWRWCERDHGKVETETTVSAATEPDAIMAAWTAWRTWSPQVWRDGKWQEWGHQGE